LSSALLERKATIEMRRIELLIKLKRSFRDASASKGSAG
jgi:hypothetical protein